MCQITQRATSGNGKADSQQANEDVNNEYLKYLHICSCEITVFGEDVCLTLSLVCFRKRFLSCALWCQEISSCQISFQMHLRMALFIADLSKINTIPSGMSLEKLVAGVGKLSQQPLGKMILVFHSVYSFFILSLESLLHLHMHYLLLQELWYHWDHLTVYCNPLNNTRKALFDKIDVELQKCGKM